MTYIFFSSSFSYPIDNHNEYNNNEYRIVYIQYQISIIIFIYSCLKYYRQTNIIIWQDSYYHNKIFDI